MASYETLHGFDSTRWKLVIAGIDFGLEADQMFPAIFGVGWGFRSVESKAKAPVGGVEVLVLYAGPQMTFDGLDQINAQAPRALARNGKWIWRRRRAGRRRMRPASVSSKVGPSLLN